MKNKSLAIMWLGLLFLINIVCASGDEPMNLNFLQKMQKVKQDSENTIAKSKDQANTFWNKVSDAAGPS